MDKKEETKKEKIISNTIAIVVFIGILAFFVFYRAGPSTPDVIEKDFNGFKFYQDNNSFWHTQLRTIYGDQDVPFRLHPTDVQGYRYDSRTNQALALVQEKKGKVTIVFDSRLADPSLSDKGKSAIAGVEIAKITSKVFGMPTESAFTSPIEGADNITISSCSDANSTNFVFEFRLAEEYDTVRVESHDFCSLLIVTELNDTVKLADLVSYQILGII